MKIMSTLIGRPRKFFNFNYLKRPEILTFAEVGYVNSSNKLTFVRGLFRLSSQCIRIFQLTKDVEVGSRILVF